MKAELICKKETKKVELSRYRYTYFAPQKMAKLEKKDI